MRLEQEGHRTVTLSRRPASSQQVAWEPNGEAGTLSRHLEGVDAVVNLAGENLAGGRWTAARKRRLSDSRILSTRTLARAIAACTRAPRVFIGGSGVGYYGPHGDEAVSETTPAGSDFLAGLCVEWEREAGAAESPSTRVAVVRTGVVMGREGGAIAAMRLPFTLGLGATLGSGTQYLPWIHVDDWTAMVSWIIQDGRVSGPLNACAPEPVTNREFTRTLARVLRRPAIFTAPAFVMRAALGEMAGMLLTGQRALPVRAEQLGFRFTYRALAPALESLNL